jgi:hypothetical protein
VAGLAAGAAVVLFLAGDISKAFKSKNQNFYKISMSIFF